MQPLHVRILPQINKQFSLMGFVFFDETESINEKSCVKTLSKIFLARRDSSKFHCFIIQALRSLNESFARLRQIGIVTLVIQSP